MIEQKDTIYQFISGLIQSQDQLNKLHSRVDDLEGLLREIMDLIMEKKKSDIGGIFLNPEEAASVLGVSTKWLREIRKNGEIGFRKMSNKQIRYRISDIEEYMESKHVKKL